MSELFFTKADLRNALAFYEITDESYGDKTEEARRTVEGDGILSVRFREICETLYCRKRADHMALWSVQGTERDPFSGMPPYSTDLSLLSGFKTHEERMRKRGIDTDQRERQIFRVRQQLLMGGAKPVSTVPVIWGAYFSNLYLVELGRLQFDFHNIDGDLPENTVGLHIPPEGRLEPEAVDASLKAAKSYIPKVFGQIPDAYVCSSWLLSPEVRSLCRDDSNMARFYDRFDVIETEKSCVGDVLGFLFRTGPDTPFTELAEETSLQRAVKTYLLSGGGLKLGKGRMK